MAQATVHLYDYRTGERRAVEGDHWYQANWWTASSGSTDSVRTAMMYPDGTNFLGSNFILNLIVVEKIVSGGQIVYREEVQKLPPLVVSMLVAVNRMAHVEFITANMQAQPVEELYWAVADLKRQRNGFVACTGESAVFQSFDKVVMAMDAFAEAVAAKLPVRRLNELADGVEDSCFQFKLLTQSACGVFKKRLAA